MISVAAIVSMAMFDALSYWRWECRDVEFLLLLLFTFGVFYRFTDAVVQGQKPRLHGEKEKQILLLMTI